MFWIALSIAFAGYCLGCGVEECGRQVRKGLESLALSIEGDIE